MPSFVSVEGFISKGTAEGRARIDRLFASAHFCLVPSRAECLAVAIAEASSFGVPSIATLTGGIPTAITAGQNGTLFPVDSYVENAVRYLQTMTNDREEYERLALGSFDLYASRLNWFTAASRMKQLLIEVTQQAHARP
jgi:glycosyltransferase involved in cell wall biosynthesis